MNRRQLILGAPALAACQGAPAATAAPAPPFPMRKGVNLGNALEAPSEGDWGYRIAPADLDAIAAAGFDGVRLPVRWDAHMAAAAPFSVEPAFLGRVKEVVSAALAVGLFVQLDVHHYAALIEHPEAEADRFRALWAQLARAFAGAPPRLLFEALNEPHGPALAERRLTALQAAALAQIRPLHPERLVIVGGGNWNSIDGLSAWTPPPDPRLAVSVHYYEPHAFTHENAEWLGAQAPRFGRPWGDEADMARLTADAARAARWAAARGVALQLGEFGVNRRVPLAQRALWTGAARRAFEAEGAAWCVWDFAGAFPIWDRARGAFYPEMREALFGG
ncbi:MAG: glycoside hydrolase family 5 protein [Hyphomonadaceae bacterium]